MPINVQYSIRFLTSLLLLKRLDSAFESCLVSLPSGFSSTEGDKPLRVALNQSTDKLLDQLASSISQLAVSVDKDQMEILADMYDVPLSGVARRLQSPNPAIDDEEEDGQAFLSIGKPQRRRQR